VPRFTHPLTWRLVQPDPAGPVRVRVTSYVPIQLRNTRDRWVGLDALVDTGASYSMMPTEWARRRRLPVPATTSRVNLLTANGPHAVAVRDAVYAVRFPRLPERTFELLWLLRDDLPVSAPVLLGLHNTVDLVSILFDGEMRPDGFMGCIEFSARDA
jgi:hypothetical protein